MVSDDDRPFRPRAARVVSLAVAGLVVALTAALLLAMPSLGWLDRAGFVVVGLAIAWFCWREAAVVARPDATGLVVRNLLLTRRLAWAQIVSVRFGQGRPWVQLDLDDGDTLAVMAIQRADGALADQEARRLATLLAARTATREDD